MSKLCEKEKKISKSQITDNDLVSNSSKLYKYTYLLEPVFQNIYIITLKIIKFTKNHF